MWTGGPGTRGLPRSCSRRPLASTSCAYFLPASLMFLKGKDVSLCTSTTEGVSRCFDSAEPCFQREDQRHEAGIVGVSACRPSLVLLLGLRLAPCLVDGGPNHFQPGTCTLRAHVDARSLDLQLPRLFGLGRALAPIPAMRWPHEQISRRKIWFQMRSKVPLQFRC